MSVQEQTKPTLQLRKVARGVSMAMYDVLTPASSVTVGTVWMPAELEWSAGCLTCGDLQEHFVSKERALAYLSEHRGWS